MIELFVLVCYFIHLCALFPNSYCHMNTAILFRFIMPAEYRIRSLSHTIISGSVVSNVIVNRCMTSVTWSSWILFIFLGVETTFSESYYFKCFLLKNTLAFYLLSLFILFYLLFPYKMWWPLNQWRTETAFVTWWRRTMWMFKSDQTNLSLSPPTTNPAGQTVITVSAFVFMLLTVLQKHIRLEIHYHHAVT